MEPEHCAGPRRSSPWSKARCHTFYNASHPMAPVVIQHTRQQSLWGSQPPTGVLVRSHTGVEGTPTLLSSDMSSEHVLYVDQAQGLVGLLE